MLPVWLCALADDPLKNENTSGNPVICFTNHTYFILMASIFLKWLNLFWQSHQFGTVWADVLNSGGHLRFHHWAFIAALKFTQNEASRILFQECTIRQKKWCTHKCNMRSALRVVPCCTCYSTCDIITSPDIKHSNLHSLPRQSVYSGFI